MEGSRDASSDFGGPGASRSDVKIIAAIQASGANPRRVSSCLMKGGPRSFRESF